MQRLNKKNILILKNDRAGDLFTSLKLISSLGINNKIKIYLSELNYGFSFFFKTHTVKKINLNLSFLDKIKIFFDIFRNKYDEVYILTPKNYYFILPFIFQKIKFYAIVYDNYHKMRPNKFLRKYLYKFNIIYRDKLNKNNYRVSQLNLLNKEITIDQQFSNLHIPKFSTKKNELLPENFIFFQFRYKFFETLKWDFKDILNFLLFLNKKYEYVLFCSDKETNYNTIKYVNFFLKEFSFIDFNETQSFYKKNKKIIYLKNLDSLDFFQVTKLAKYNIGPHGILSHLSYFHKVPSLNLFNFKVSSKKDMVHQKISFSEWYKDMNLNFSFLNEDFLKTLKKINTRI